MQPFNLAQAKIAERAYCQDYINRRLRSIGLLIGLVLAVAVGSYACRIKVTGKETQAVSELADVTGRTVEIRREISDLEAELSRHAWKNQLAAGSARWLDVLETVLGCVPPDVWLTRLESSLKDSTVSVEGSANSFETVSAFVDAMRARSTFVDVRLGEARVATASGVAFVDFVVHAKLQAAAGTSTDPVPVARSGSVPDAGETP